MLSTFQKNIYKSDFHMNITTENNIRIFWSDFETFLANHCYKNSDIAFMVIIDPIVLSNHSFFLQLEGELENLQIVPFNVGEKEKEFAAVQECLKLFIETGIDRRNDKVFCVGGGALMDVVSFACSIYRRGIHVTKVPTTLLGFVDASIGIKTGVNLFGNRNRIGTYHGKFDVILDEVMLTGLSATHVIQGLGEIFKIAVIKSQKLFSLLHQNKKNISDDNFFQTEHGSEIISVAIELMLEELHENPEEMELKRCVDFGHTFSPLVEMESVNNKDLKTIPHGNAVAFDCFLSCVISRRRNLICAKDFQQIKELYMAVNFDFLHPAYLDNPLMWESVLDMTKHRGGNQHIPVPSAIGKYTFIEDLSYSEMLECKEQLRDIVIKWPS